MELQLGLALSTPNLTFDLNHRHRAVKNKRLFEEAFGQNYNHTTTTTLSLFTKHNQQDDDDDDEHPQILNHHYNTSTDGDESSIIGWPPVKSWRRKQCHGIVNNRTVEINRQRWRGSVVNGRSTYVKVKMEGVGIARKVDLSLHHSYQTLTNTLIPMFGKRLENVKHYRLTYQDKDGDWLLAAHLPWSVFKQSVQRLKLAKIDG